MAAMVNMSNLLNGKDSRWLQLEVCREFQRNKCSRPDTECKFAHPPANVEVQNGRVTACYDSIKGRCQREKPPCKYFHPPQHLKDQLLINGRNHLALKNALMQQMGMAPPTPSPTIIPSPLQPMTANRFLPAASNPYSNPYFTTGALLPTTIIGPEHALASTTQLPQAVPLGAAATTNSAVQPQKRTDRVQNTPTSSSSAALPSSNGNQITNSSVPLISSASLLANLVESGKKRTAECLQMFPALLPYKRPAPDKPTTGIQAVYHHQPSAAAYQQLMQLQSAHQSAYVPVSSHQNSINQSSPSSKAIIIPSTLDNNTPLSKNATSNVVATAVAVAASSADDGDETENALSLQNPKNAHGTNGLLDASVAVSQSVSDGALLDEPNNNNSCTKSMSDLSSAAGIDLSQQNGSLSAADDGTATKASSVHASVDESNLNAISFNSATSSSPAVATSSAIYTTSSISTSLNNNNNNVNNYNSSSANNMISSNNNFSNNNSILSARKNSLTTPNQQLINSSSNCSSNSYSANASKAPYATNTSGKADSVVPDLLANASSLNNSHLLSAVFYNQQPTYQQQFALAQNHAHHQHHLYSTDAAQLAKEMAQKNYANALKLAAGKQPTAQSLNAMPYSGMAAALSANNSLQQPGTSNVVTPRLPAPSRAPYMAGPNTAAASALSRPMQNPYQTHSFIRPPMQHVNLTAAAAAANNPYFAAAAAHQQFLSQQNFLYSGLASPMASPQLTAVTSGAPSHQTHTPFASSAAAGLSYPFAAAQSLQAAHGLPTSMMQVPQITSQSSQTGSSSAVVLNPYKKMKTS